MALDRSRQRSGARAVIAIASLAIAAAGCDGEVGGYPAGPRRTGLPIDRGPVDPGCPPPPGSDSRTEQVRVGLAPVCAGCHSESEKGYFASLTAFESLLVRDARLVRPGDPDASELVLLLEGRRTGASLSQMPISGDAFAVMAERGETDITMAEIRDWIAQLETPDVDTRPLASAPTVQRISAMHIEFGLRELLGLTHEDFYAVAHSHGVPEAMGRSEDHFYVRSPDRAPSTWGTVSRYLALGGGAAMVSKQEERSVSTSFVQTLVPIAQAWCGMAVRKSGNTALFDVATPATGITDRATVREQIADWHLLFLATLPSDAEVDEIVETVFAPLESGADTTTAWIGTCSHFVRHPLFVFY
jgi:hypothetical protein